MKPFRGSILLLLISFICTAAFGQTETLYTGNANGTFENPADWTDGVPNANLDAAVSPGAYFTSAGSTGTLNGINTINLSESSNQAAAGLDFFSTYDISDGATSPGTINFTISPGNTLVVGQNYTTGIRDTNQTTVNFSGGTIQLVSGDITIGQVPNITGYTLTGLGAFNISSGSLIYNESMYVGDGTDSTGSFSQSGSSTVSGGQLYVGFNGSTGTYSMSGAGSLTINGNVYIADGTGSSGTFTQSAGSFTETGNTAFSVGETGTGTYTISGGSGSFNRIIIGQTSTGMGTINQTSGGISASGNTIIGDFGNGTYNLSGGISTLSGTLTLGSQANSSGTLNQYNGNLSVSGLTTIGAAGTGIYNISGGSASFSGGMALGNASGTGTVNQNGGIVIIGSGMTIDLSHAGSSYSLAGGTLEIGTGGLVGVSGDGTFNFGGGTFDATASLTDALNGTLSGNSTLESPGTIILSGVLSGGGSLTLSSGTLQASSANLPSIGSVTLGGGTTFNLTTSGNANDTFNGTISGAGSLETGNSGVSDAGTTITVPAGYKLHLHTVNLPTGTTTIANNTGLVAANGTLNSLSGGTGTTFEVGGGNGTIRLTGTATVPTITVDSGSTLAAATVIGNITTTGTVMTLSPVSNFNETGIFNQPQEASVAQEGTLVVNTNGTSSDVYSVTSGTLYGTVKVSGVGSNSYEIVRAATPGALTTGTLNSATPGGLATSPNLPLFTSTLSYVLPAGPNSAEGLELTTVQSNLSPFALTHNQMAVSAAIDTVIQHPPQSFVPLLLAINTLTGSDVPELLDQLSPRGYLYMRDIAFENSTFLAQKVDGFLGHLRDGYSGLDTSGLSILSPGLDTGLGRSLGSLLAYNNEGVAPNGVNYYPEDPDAPIAPNAGPGAGPGASSPGTISDSEDPRLAPTVAPPPSTSIFDGKGTGFNEFVSGDVVLADLNQNGSGNNEPKAHYTAGNATAGISFRMSSNLAAGILFDYNHTDAKTDAEGSHVRVDTYSPGLFATFFEKGFYANGIFTFGYDNYSNNRNLSFGGAGATATSNPNGQQYVGDLDFGYDFHPNQHWAVGPTLGIEYTHLDIDSFHESGAGDADLAVASQSADSLRGRIGAHAVYLARAGQILFQPNLTLAFQREFLNDDFNLGSQLDIPGTPAFSIQGSNPGRNSALIGLGLTATLDNDMSLYLDYLAEIGGDNYFVQSVEGGLKASF